MQLLSNTNYTSLGIGLNLDNQEPTFCLNEIIRKYNAQNSTQLPLWTPEQLLAKFHITFEVLVSLCCSSQSAGGNSGSSSPVRAVHDDLTQGFQYFRKIYEAYWLHQDQIIRIFDDELLLERMMKIIGINEQGLLMATPHPSAPKETLLSRIFSQIWTRFRGDNDVGNFSNRTAIFTIQPQTNSLDLASGIIRPK